jgi:DNA-binding response OmpR family regulator
VQQPSHECIVERGVAQQPAVHECADQRVGDFLKPEPLGADDKTMESSLRASGGTATVSSTTAVLLVEDDDRISEPLVRVLRSEGFEVTHVAAGLAALASVGDHCPDLVLLDLTLPDIDGLDVCRKLRSDHPSLPIIMLTARAEEMDVIVGLNAGADDYVAKPFRLAELVARIRARLRLVEHSTASTNGHLSGAGIELDTEARRCFVEGDDAKHNEVELTTKEFDLLELLMRQPGVTLKRELIMSQVWDENWWGSTRTLDTHTSTLRRKILDDSDPPSKIVTVRGVGFRFDPIGD